ncbi:hypothetical protein [Candidatus Marithrix sp. Canyon 246]|uniref:hypothetical protein n=1 Tax=Candidatus Marithrix sp. Canyon 246 TaxID=1827136 RepID=UPI00084A2C06|nr:hypothetical protein [Candidatus Marithrix sp. Canyon 246]
MLYTTNVYAQQSINGVWQISSYQIIAYPAIPDTEIKNWIGRKFEFTSEQQAILHHANKTQTCSKFNQQLTSQNSEAYFLIGYGVKPQRLGVTTEEVPVVSINCQQASWLSKRRDFVILNDQQMLSYWDGVIFFFSKQAESSRLRITNSTIPALIITPQSVGLLNPNSDCNEQSLRQALHGYDIKSKPGYFELYRFNKLMLVVFPNKLTGKVNRIRILDTNIQVPGNAKLGFKYRDIFKANQLVTCKLENNLSFCAFANISSIQYVFKQQPRETLIDAKLVEIIWNADQSLIIEPPEVDFSIPSK